MDDMVAAANLAGLGQRDFSLQEGFEMLNQADTCIVCAGQFRPKSYH